MNKLIELRRAKMLALSLLLIAAATFVVTLFLPPNFWVSGVKAIAEAAMVGALADWVCGGGAVSPRADSDHFSSYGDYSA
ncbi:inner membrane protein [Escherichia coli]|uniref:Inner membrane protein n=1 Tax=Escherichia coli TaxID=562 RepID=A0A377E361_ECOLX|nr:inner membrane protein [Escherichia coli]